MRREQRWYRYMWSGLGVDVLTGLISAFLLAGESDRAPTLSVTLELKGCSELLRAFAAWQKPVVAQGIPADCIAVPAICKVLCTGPALPTQCHVLRTVLHPCILPDWITGLL